MFFDHLGDHWSYDPDDRFLDDATHYQPQFHIIEIMLGPPTMLDEAGFLVGGVLEAQAHTGRG